jgi:hypothetical protein
MSDAIRIKPHHFVDILRAFGEGQTAFEPHPYGHAVHLVAERVLRERDAMLEMELGADAICEPCVHNVGGLCDDTIDTSFRPDAPASKREYNLRIDERWCARLALAQGHRLTARELCRRLADGMGDLRDIYRENPPERVAAREAALRAGIASFLGGEALPGG